MYDWDDLELDSTQHNSKMFFAGRHSKHELKIEENNTPNAARSSSADEFLVIINDLKLTDNPSSENKTESIAENANACHENKENEPKSNVLPVQNHEGMKTNKIKLVTPSRFVRPVNGAVPKAITSKAGPSARLIAVSNKREELLRKQIEEEKKMREFHSRPKPVFKVPDIIKKHAVTVPKTPVVAKRSKESQQKRLAKLKQIEDSLKPVPFKAQSADVLKETPFIPKKAPTLVVTKPYNLRSDQRLANRKKYDEAVQRALDEKKKQEEEEQKRLEEECRRELRKATVFKARPNPFK